ncbi:hypothetical protein SMC26_18495 [Actinomadura fulvescens]|uniref:Guanylate cyclase domain-containing protein n=1 Tax=Actinomadura fulvescens TaxID=46160 RepID=A0ABP6CRU7_9ACTN
MRVQYLLRLLTRARQRTTAHLPRQSDGRGQGKHRRQYGVMFVFDIADFSSRPAYVQEQLRDVLYDIVEKACNHAGVRWRHCFREDRGDGMFILDAHEPDSAVVINQLAVRIADALHRHNLAARAAARMQLRMAVHVGYFRPDPHGITSPDLIHTFRLLNAEAFKKHLAASGADLALIVSDYLYGTAASYNQIDPGDYRPISVMIKDEEHRAWIRRNICTAS